MKLRSFINAILISFTLIHGSQSFEQEVAGMRGGSHSKIVYKDRFVRSEKDYDVFETNDLISYAFIPHGTDTLQKWSEKINFLLELFIAGRDRAIQYQEIIQLHLDAAVLEKGEKHQNIEQLFLELTIEGLQHRMTYHEAKKVKQARALNNNFLNAAVWLMKEIYQSLISGGYIFDRPLNHLYQHVRLIIDEIEGLSEDSLLVKIVDTMYVPIREWIEDQLPICSLNKYMAPIVSSEIDKDQLTPVYYHFQHAKYLQDFKKKPEYLDILAFIEKKREYKEELEEDLGVLIDTTSEENLMLEEARYENGTLLGEFNSGLRYMENIIQMEKTIISKWTNKIQEYKKVLAERLLNRRKIAENRQFEVKQKAVQDSAKILEWSFQAAGLEYNPASPTIRKRVKKQSREKQVKSIPVKLKKDTEVVSEISSTTSKTQEEREKTLAIFQSENAVRNARMAKYQQVAKEKRDAKKEADAMVADVIIQRRQKTWVEKAFDAKLASFDPLQQISLEDLNHNPDFDVVCRKLRSVGCYVDPNIHGNEKGVARWVGIDGTNVMVWFDRPHGSQLKMGVGAGWFKSILKRLRETGKLAESVHNRIVSS